MRLTLRKTDGQEGHSQPLVVSCLYQPTDEKAGYNICVSGWDQPLPREPVSPLPACLVAMGFSFCKGPTAAWWGGHAKCHLKEDMQCDPGKVALVEG